jgi:hypothetical protein
MKTYIGVRQEDGALCVTVNGQPLNPRLDLWNHSPTGFECGYGGSGPAQLALALLADHLNHDEQAVALHQCFKRKVVSGLPAKGWRLTSRQIERALQAARRADGVRQASSVHTSK